MSPEMEDAIARACSARRKAASADSDVWKVALKELDVLLRKTDLLEFHIDAADYMILTADGEWYSLDLWELPLPEEITEMLEEIDQYRVDEYGNEVWKKGEGWQ